MKCSTNTIAKTALVAIVILLGAAPAMRADPRHHRNADVLNPNARPYGKSYEQWSAEWWTWFMEHPLAGHPGVDSPDFDVRSGQEGDVWFLASPFGTVERTVDVPFGKALFIGLLNAEASDIEYGTVTEAEQRELAEWFADHIVGVSCSIDGSPVKHIERFRVQSPQFSFVAPDPWVFSPAPGGAGTAVADGYYVMVPPLSKGEHTIRINGAFHFDAGELGPDPVDFGLEMTYHINVECQARIVPADESFAGRDYSEWSAKATKFSMELPLEGHPALDTNPDFDASYGQRGNVWFLGAPFGSNTRSINIPPGKALFFVLMNTECSSLEALDSGFHGDTEGEQRDCAKFWSDHIVNPFFIVNGQEVETIDDFRIVSPQFKFHAPTPWIFGETGGRGTSVADGYYVMLRPLSQGTYTIHFGGTLHFEDGELGPDPVDLPIDMTYFVTVN